MTARIFQPSRTAMQQGRRKTHHWVLEFLPEQARHPDPLMGWTSSGDMKGQIELRFPSQAEAVAYAKRHGIDYVLTSPPARQARPKSYADNFRWDRVH
jgi:ETC complex I subunit conserved region